jgi:putative ABC transport system permease protein
LFLRTTGAPSDSVAAVRTAIREIERHAVVHEVRAMDDIAAESAGITRLAMQLLGGFAGIALALSAVGIYGVMSYSVRRQTRELGTRVALGATPGDIVRLVMRQAVLVSGAGLAIGIGAGLLSARSLSSVLFDVPPWDMPSVAAAAAILAATALTASYLPARRAARIDPATTLVSD